MLKNFQPTPSLTVLNTIITKCTPANSLKQSYINLKYNPMTKQKKQPPKKENTNWLIIFVFFIIAFLVTAYRKVVPEKNKTDKGILFKQYGVNKRTFTKWVEYFCDPNILPIEIYSNKRRLSESELAHIYESLGVPSETTPVLSKGQIVDLAAGDYKSLRDGVLSYSDKYGISKKAYDTLNVFPPRISDSILKQYT
jgi:hypothetical protein